MPPPHDPTSDPHAQLRHRRLGVPSLVFLIIAASAPLTVLAGGVPTSFAISGNIGVPLGYLVLGAILALFAVGYGAMSSSITNAGAFYAYIAAGLGVRQGIAASILALVAYNGIQISLYGLLGFSLSSFLEAKAGIAVPWWVCALVVLLVVAAMGVARIDFSAKVIAVLVALEFAIVIAVDLLAVGAAPEGLTAAPLAPDSLFTAGLGAVLAFGVAAFMGFESGAIYSEEVRDPHRSVSRATFIAVLIIATFYGLSAWALAMGVGVSGIVPAAQELGPDLMFVFLVEQSPGWFVDLANLLFMTSMVAALVAFHNAVARYFFSLGRTGVIPTWFARVSERTGAPVGGSVSQSVIALVAVVVFAVAGIGSELGPLFPVVTLFTWFSNAAAFGLVFLMGVTSIAVLAYLGRRPEAHGLFVRVIAPALAALGLGAVFVTIMMNFDLLIGVEGLTPLVIIMPAIILGSGVLGLVRGEYLRRHRPDIFRAAATDLDQPV